MLLGTLSFVIMLAGAYAFWRQGALPALVMAINILLAGLIAFNFFEPIAVELDPMLDGSFLHGYEDSLCLVALFSLTLVFLRWATNALIHTTIEYHAILQQGGAVVFGLLAGYLVAGFLLCVAQTLPLDEHFLKFDARVDASAKGEKMRRILPPDRVWLALMHRASIASLSWDEDSSFDPDGSYELRYGHERRTAAE
ncbi:MAG TPA: CvpA family protein [Gemmataceae bacterium]|jgi:uncharacterized membrane protein required for colicin V production